MSRTAVVFPSVITLLAILQLGCVSTVTREPDIQRITSEELEKLIPPPVAAISLDQIVAFAKQGMAAEAIIDKLKQSNSQYALSVEQTLQLSNQGVPLQVLDWMQQAQQQRLKDSLVDEMNKREAARVKEQEKLKRQWLSRPPYPFYDPLWGPAPYWRHPYYGPRSGLYYRFGW